MNQSNTPIVNYSNFTKRLATISCLFLVLLFVQSCSTTEGEGGRATLKGKVLVQLFDKNTLTYIDSYYARDERVYIVYGDNEIYDNDTRTNYDGQFQFTYLYPGKYTIFTYSECVCNEIIEPIFAEIEITDTKGTTEVPEIVINRYE